MSTSGNTPDVKNSVEDTDRTRLVPGVGRLPHPAYRGNGPYAFVSYSHEDHDEVFAEIARFNEAGFNVWYDEGIAPGNEWAAEIARALANCSLFIVMVTPRSVASNNVRDEIAFALEEDKPAVAIHLEETELPDELKLRTRRIQSILKYTMDDEEYAYRYVEAFERLGLERESVSSGFGETGLGTASQPGDDNRGGKGGNGNLPVKAIAIGVVCLLLVALAAFFVFGNQGQSGGNASGAAESQAASSSAATTQAVSSAAASQEASSQAAADQSSADAAQDVEIDVDVREELGEYSWTELKAISAMIAAASSDEEGLEIAKSYNLVDADGNLNSDRKPIAFSDSTASSVRILGFRHDTLASGGLAGITFEFADIPYVKVMNSSATNDGGWEASEMREWLNSDFIDLMPPDLSTCIEEAAKRTNNTGKADRSDDTSVVTETTDKIWLLSMSEVYGEFSAQSDNVPATPLI